MPEKVQDSTASGQDCFTNSSEWFAKWNPDLCCWRTSQLSLLGGWMTYSGRWPRSGLMRNGIAYRLRPLVPRISGTGYSFLPTPDTGESKNGHGRRGVANSGNSQSSRNLDAMANTGKWPFFPTPCAGRKGLDGGSNTRMQAKENGTWVPTGKLNPEWVEWLMGFPLGWTDCEDSGTP